jgi:hypothetical protein
MHCTMRVPKLLFYRQIAAPARITRSQYYRPVAGHWLVGRIQQLQQRFSSTRSITQAREGFSHRPVKNAAAQCSGLYKSTCPRGNRSSNVADRIQDQLHKDGHCVWGFVVYRCTYGDDAALGDVS